MPSRSYKNSLLLRVQLAMGLIILLFIGATGAVLENAFKRSLDESTKTEMDLQLYLILAKGEFSDGKLWLPKFTTNDAFDSVNSGLYAFVTQNKNIIWQSNSALLYKNKIDFASECCEQGEHKRSLQKGTEPVFIYQKGVAWADNQGNTHPYTVSVVQSTEKHNGAIMTYRSQLWMGLISMALCLLAVQYLVMRWSLRPITTAATEVKKIKSGQQSLLTQNYPLEMQSLTQSINDLIEQEKLLKQRYRNTLANLAHSIKTPLAVIRSAIGSTVDENSINDSVTRIDDIVQHQLNRAVFSGTRYKGEPVDARRSINRIVTAMDKVYADKSIRCSCDFFTDSAKFFGDESDLMEILGNVIDNAYKYGNSKVRIYVDNVIQNEQDIPLCRITVEDDGEGISEDYRHKILSRGFRVDTDRPGQGIGLAIVLDIVDQYEGTIDIQRSKLGGLKITVTI